jgi:hypothetical protein
VLASRDKVANAKALTLNNLVSSGNVFCSSFEEYDVEAAIVDGPLSVSGEATLVAFNDENNPAAADLSGKVTLSRIRRKLLHHS